MSKKIILACVCLCLALGTLRANGQQQPIVDTARKTLQNYEKAVISLAAVLKLEAKGVEGIGGLDQEHKTQCAAAIIDPSGMAITSLTNLNPQNALPKIRINRGGVPQTLELDCQVQEVKYRLSDGTEVPARIVLKDEDLDLAFLAPLKPLDDATRAKIACIPLAEPAAAPGLLDETILVGRTPEELNYIPTLNVGRIVAILTKPRTCYMGNMGALGTPVFDRGGKMLGLICRCVKAESDDSGSMMRMASTLAATSQLILPAADVAKLLPQAKEEAKKTADSEKKDAEKKDTEKKDASALKTNPKAS